MSSVIIALLFWAVLFCLLTGIVVLSVKALVLYYRQLKIEQKPLINKTTVKIGASILAALILWAGYNFVINLEPIATVIDAETGKPVEDAVVLAQWFSAGGGALFEGGVQNLDKTAEAFSDKDGKIYIKRNIFSGTPSLTVYKPGYVLWDSRNLCPTLEARTDFDENHRIVELLKFDTEAPRWIKEYPNRGFGLPHEMQDGCFVFYFIESETRQRNTTFSKIFYEYEQPFLNKEHEIILKRYNQK